MLLNCIYLFRIKLGSDRTLTVVRCHPNSNTLAIGDNTGRIVLYYNVMHKNTRSQTVYHWHTLPVNDVLFTSSGETTKIVHKKKIVILIYISLQVIIFIVEVLKMSWSNGFVKIQKLDIIYQDYLQILSIYLLQKITNMLLYPHKTIVMHYNQIYY